MERLVPKRHVFTVSKKFQSRGWTASVCENGSTGAHGGCLVRSPCPCRVKIMTASCCLEQVWHIPSLELSWCPSGSVLVKLNSAQWKESEHRVLSGPWALLSWNSIVPPKLCLKQASGTACYVFVVGEGGVLPPSHPTWNRGTSLLVFQTKDITWSFSQQIHLVQIRSCWFMVCFQGKYDKFLFVMVRTQVTIKLFNLATQ